MKVDGFCVNVTLYYHYTPQHYFESLRMAVCARNVDFWGTATVFRYRKLTRIAENCLIEAGIKKQARLLAPPALIGDASNACATQALSRM